MKIKNYRSVVVALLFFATTINYMDRQIIGLLKPTLETEFNWTETDFAHIVMAFTAAYALGLLLFGRFIDWVGTKIGYAVSVVIWSVAGMSGAIGGMLFPLLVGFLLDYYKAFGNISIGYNVIFTFCGCTYLVVWLIIMLLIKRSENVRIETII
jgi:sugar phosphate permease